MGEHLRALGSFEDTEPGDRQTGFPKPLSPIYTAKEWSLDITMFTSYFISLSNTL